MADQDKKRPDKGYIATQYVDNGVPYGIIQEYASGAALDDGEISEFAKKEAAEREALKAKYAEEQRAVLEANRVALLASIQASRTQRGPAAREVPGPPKPATSKETASSRFVPAAPPEPPVPEPPVVVHKEDPAIAAKLAAMERELAAARAQPTPAVRWADPKFWLQLLTMLLMVVVIVKLGTSSITLPDFSSHTPETPEPSEKDLAEAKAEKKLKRLAKTLEQSSETPAAQNFESAMDRITHAAKAFPDKTLGALVSELNQQRAAGEPLTCPFQWNSAGEVVVVVDGRTSLSSPLLEGLNRCADSIERLRLKKALESKAEE